MKKFVLLLAAGVLGVAAAERIVGGPVVVNVSGRSATVVWVMEKDGATLRAATGATKSGPSLHAEKTTFTGLQPNTRYDYDVPGQTAKGSFKTPPAAGEPYRFVVFGDTRSRHDVHRRVVDAIVKSGVPDFVIHTGDLVADGNDSAMWPTFFDIEKDMLRQTVFFPALGNHERNSQEFYDFFQVTTPYYSFDWGNSHFAVLNSDIGNAASSAGRKEAFWTEQTRWLEEDLAAHQKSDFRFVIAHHPPFTTVAKRQDDNPQMKALVPMFEKYRVTAGFFGHDHNYQRYLKNGIHYIVTGGGGAPLYKIEETLPGITQKLASTEHFVTVSVNGKTAHIDAIALDGSKLDQIELKAVN